MSLREVPCRSFTARKEISVMISEDSCPNGPDPDAPRLNCSQRKYKKTRTKLAFRGYIISGNAANILWASSSTFVIEQKK